MPAGSWSVTTIPAGTSDGPLFVTVMVKVVDVPGLTAVTPSVLLIDRSAEAVTVSTSVAASFEASGSTIGVDMIDAVLVSAGGAYPEATASVSWYVIDVPTARGADVVHVNAPAPIEQSSSDSEPVVPAGIGSETTTPAGSTDGPLLVSVIV